MTDRKKRRQKIRAGYGQQPWFKFSVMILISGIKAKIRKFKKKIKKSK